VAQPVLESIEIEGFLSIRSATVSFGALNVLIGANGAGKSNLVRAFEMLGRIADQELGLFVGLNGGASALLHDGATHVQLDIIASPGVYRAVLLPAADDDFVFELETFGRSDSGWPRGYGTRSGHRETMLAGRELIGGEIYNMLRGCRMYHFHDTSRNAPVKQFVSTADNLALRNDGGNLAAVLLRLRHGTDAEHAAYRRILGVVRQVAPFFMDFVLAPENDRIRLRWRQAGSDAVFSANQMSDGTLRFICLATLLLQPALPALVVLDEPELGLHPYAIVQLAGLLRQASVRSQVVLATQSVTLMNQFQLDDLIVVERLDGSSTFSRPDPARLSDWLAEYSLGELWEKNLIGGRPSGLGMTPDA
jgi:predicted ATPase